jgi:hypothetical protein
MSVRELERELQGLGLTRMQSRVLIARGRRWRWIATFSPRLFAHVTVWRIA